MAHEMVPARGLEPPTY